MRKFLLAFCLTLGSAPAFGAGTGCQDTSGPLALEKVRASAVGSQIYGCINRSFDTLSSSAAVNNSTSTWARYGRIDISTIGAYNSTRVYLSSPVVAGSSFAIEGSTANGSAYLDSSLQIKTLPKMGNGGLVIGTAGAPSTGTIQVNASMSVTNGAGSIALAVDATSGTLQGNTFNGVSQLVKTGADSGITVASATLNGTGSNVYSLTTSSGVHIAAGGINWPDGSVSTSANRGTGGGSSGHTFSTSTFNSDGTISTAGGPFPVKSTAAFDAAYFKLYNTANDATGITLSTGVGASQKQSWTPTWTGCSANQAGTFTYTQVGGQVCVQVGISGNCTSDQTFFTMTLPVAPHSDMSGVCQATQVKDNGTWTNGELCYRAANSTTVDIYKDVTQAAFTNSGNKAISGGWCYTANTSAAGVLQGVFVSTGGFIKEGSTTQGTYIVAASTLTATFTGGYNVKCDLSCSASATIATRAGASWMVNGQFVAPFSSALGLNMVYDAGGSGVNCGGVFVIPRASLGASTSIAIAFKNGGGGTTTWPEVNGNTVNPYLFCTETF